MRYLVMVRSGNESMSAGFAPPDVSSREEAIAWAKRLAPPSSAAVELEAHPVTELACLPSAPQSPAREPLMMY